MLILEVLFFYLLIEQLFGITFKSFLTFNWELIRTYLIYEIIRISKLYQKYGFEKFYDLF